MDSNFIQEELAKLRQSQLGQGAVYAGGIPDPLKAQYGIETLIRTEYGAMVDIDQPHAWFRLLMFMGPVSTCCLVLIDMKQAPGAKFNSHFDWKTELSLGCVNMEGHDVAKALNLVQTNLPRQAVAPIDGIKAMLGKYRDDAFFNMVKTIDYRKKTAAVACSPDFDTSFRKLKFIKRLGMVFEERDGVAVAVLEVNK